MERLACKLITWMIDMQAITEEDRELYEYAAYSFFITMAPLMLVILFGSFMGFLVESIVFIIPFMAIRKFSGGYHMKSPITCFVISCFLLLFCIILSYNLIYDRKVIIVLLISSISL
ncbi:accessory gene regulator B family protein, partial [Floccifex sp.]|uniref:accessory gene regulator B family protein n=1 Tax=Floccifex sp. TaxID=2815810 RepID=UPI003F07CD6F